MKARKSRQPKRYTGNSKDQVVRYDKEGRKIDKEMKRLLKTTDEFETTSDTPIVLTIQNKSFRIRQTMSRSPDTENEKDPVTWYTETVCPGSPKLVCESLMNPKYRKKWDLNISSFEQIPMDPVFPNIFIHHTIADNRDGDYLSARDVVELISINEVEDKTSFQVSSKSIDRKDIPKIRGFARDNTMICGILFEKLSPKERKKMKIPKLKKCEWTRIRYILQTKNSDSLDHSGVNAAMAHTSDEMMKGLRNYIIQKRLKLDH